MALTRLDNLYSSKTGKYLYVSPDDFNATDALDNRGNSPLRPFKTIQRAFVEVSRFSYVPGSGNDRFDQFSIMLMPGNHYIDNRPGLIDTTASPEFSFDQLNNEWTDNSVLDLGDTNNVLYKFNATTGGAIVPRGCSLVGYDLRRTIIRPLYVPDPVDSDVGRTSIFNLTGGCYLWQFTIKDGDLSENSPLFNGTDNVGKVYTQPEGTLASLKVPEFSHHKICIMEYAENKELDLYYEKVGKAFSQFQPTIDDAGELDPLVQENRIVGPLSDSRSIDNLQIVDNPGGSTSTITITTKIEHGYFEGQYVAVLNTGLDEELNGTFKISISNTDPKVFSYTYEKVAASVGLTSGNTYTTTTVPQLGTGAIALAEIDSVESASPYVFNCSIRSTWGQCGMWANGSKATGFRSMVVAQYTGVSLQKDDRAFIRYDKFTNTWNQASLVDAFATVPYHTKGDAYWKDDWRNFHIRASDDSFIQCVSVFAVGFFDHFLMESGGDMSITNSNSNFGNTSLHAIGHKGYAFNQDKGGYITDIIPPRTLNGSRAVAEKVQYYSLDVIESNDVDNHTRLYIGSESALNPENTPAASISGYRIGAKSGEKLYVKLAGSEEYRSELSPSGFKKYTASLSTLNPSNISNFLDNFAQDAANRIIDNKEFIQNEAYGYITTKYPALLTNGNITISKCRRDIGYIVDAVVSDLRLTLDTSGVLSNDFTDTSNINVIQAAESYYVGTELDYIENELSETLDAYEYVRDLCIAAMRNWDYLIIGSTITNGDDLVTVGDTTGLVVGMTIAEYLSNDFTNGKLNVGAIATSNIPVGTTITEIVNDTQIRISNASTGTNTNAYLYFDLLQGFYDSNVVPTSDDTITQDTAYPECGNIANLIESYFADISDILSNGLTNNSVVRRESQINTASLAVRSTVFTINTGGGTSNPHNFETGTAVRLVPRAKVGTNPDKRLIRLPSGFNTNQKYYVIAPGRKTSPEDYSITSNFDQTNQTKLMLASSKENAAAGIYIYSPETDVIDTDVEIDVYQYVLDDKYDLHKYVCNATGDGGPEVLETDVSHHFDVPVNGGIIQEVFFRTASDINGSALPILSSGFGGTEINTQTSYYARYIKSPGQAQKKFSIHQSIADAINNVSAVTFQPGSGSNFYVLSNKRESPLRFDPTRGATGIWYLNVKDESSGINPVAESILTRLHQPDYNDASGQELTSDTFFERISDTRGKEDRVYRFRYVIPKYLQSVRDPLNGFVIKMRTDEKRRLVPQRLLLLPTTGGPNVAQFNNPGTSERLEATESTYDPYVSPKVVSTTALASPSGNNNFSFTVQSAREVDGYLELTVFDHDISNNALKGKNFTVVKIKDYQGGDFSIDPIADTQTITWTGNSSGTAFVHNVVVNSISASQTDYYLILKGVQGTLDYSEFSDTTFAQTGITAVLDGKPDSIGDPDGKSKSLRDDYLYATPRATLYTAVPGDRVVDDAGNEYKIQTVEDIPEIEDTFYVFDIDELQQRIVGQQDGIYYLTAVRGNISPFPQGPGVGNNFKNFKFSQPISQLYPLNYKNDPLWFQVQANGFRDDSILDPPETVSAADNYIHGLVTVNDYKNSETKESTLDFIKNLNQDSLYTDAGNEFGLIKAQSGNATSGSEDRKIPISGNQTSGSASKLYVELRRPSIARSGNHTFEYLGFGPGNYSTGFPLRQEVVLQDVQDFYAQAKREDGGIVFYTGLNSNGDLYIGNRKINAITGEETFLESAELVESEDDSDDLGTLVTTFETAVRFEDKITVEGRAFFNNEVEINIQPDLGESLRIFSNLPDGGDGTLDRESFPNPDNGDIVLTQNKINSAIFAVNPRGNTGSPGQSYTFRTHVSSTLTGGIEPSNQTPDQNQTFNNSQLVSFGSDVPNSGDILLKGIEVGSTGSLGWIYANSYDTINDGNVNLISTVTGSNIVKITWSVPFTNNDIGIGGIKSGDTIKVSGVVGLLSPINGTWKVDATHPTDTAYNDSFNTRSYIYVRVNVNFSNTQDYNWSSLQLGRKLEISENSWKEVGVIGAEALRTETNTIGQYKLGINTIARSDNSNGYVNGFVGSATTPRANLDVVGTAFISGRTFDNYLDNSLETSQDNAFLVGGTSSLPNGLATLRVATSNDGRVGINTNSADLDRTFVVVGDSRFSLGARFEQDIEVNGGDITTTSINFNLLNTIVENLNFASTATTASIVDNVETLTIGNSTTNTQTINIGNSSVNSNINIGDTLDGNLETVSRIKIGGSFGNTNSDQSYTEIGTQLLRVNGDIWLGYRRSNETSEIRSQSSFVNLFSNSGGPSTVNFALTASELNIAGQGGTTKINNKLNVVASSKFDAGIQLCGGVEAFSFIGQRARMGSSEVSHDDGINPNGTFTKNVDLLNVSVLLPTDDGYNQVDTSGAGNWGGTLFQEASTALNLPALSGDEYYLPLANSPNKINGDPYFVNGDYIIIDSPTVGVWNAETAHPEFLQITEIVRATAPYMIKVRRKPFGDITNQLTNHPDETAVYKVNVQFNSTWIELPLDNNGTSTDNVFLAEFGGSLNANDYIILSRDDDTGNSGEVIKVGASLQQNPYQFRISDGVDCDNPDLDVFTVDSTNGDTFIKGKLSVDNSLVISGSCKTLKNETITGSLIPVDASAATFNITNISAADIAKISIGDIVELKTYESGSQVFYPFTKVEEIDSDSIKLNISASNFTAESNLQFGISKNEEFSITNGRDQNSLNLDTCTSELELGNQYRRIDISRIIPTTEAVENTVNRYSSVRENIRVYSYWHDPKSIQINGPNTTLSASATTGVVPGSVYLQVSSLGEGDGQFQVGDLVLVGDSVDISFNGLNGNQFEIMLIQEIDVPSLTIRCLPGQEGTTARNISEYIPNTQVLRILKHPESSEIYDIQLRTRTVSGATSNYVSLILTKGYIVQTILDYPNFVRFFDTTGSLSDEIFYMNSGLFGKFHEPTMNELYSIGQIGAYAERTGNLTINNDLTLIGGEVTIFDSTRKTKILNFKNDGGHADHDGELIFNATVVGRGGLTLYPSSCSENVTLGACAPSFFVDVNGNTYSQNTLTIGGNALENPSNNPKLLVNNLGVNGSSVFSVNHDRSINAFGFNDFYTKNGGRHARYIATGTDEENRFLNANITYFVNISDGDTFVVYLPENPITGDTVNIIDVGGNLTYNTSLVVRAQGIGTKVQGDSFGTTLGGLASPYNSGELIVQTPNAGFTLVYLGGIDTNGSVVSSSVTGWWLKEV